MAGLPEQDALDRVRELCLALPEASEKLSHGEPTWFVRKVFVSFANRHHDDRVAVWAPNLYEWILAAFGAQVAGAVMVPLNTRYKRSEAAFILRTSGGPITNVRIENNLIGGGNYTIYSRNGGYGNPTSIVITGNVFTRQYVYGLLSADGPVTWTNNTWQDSGTAA